MVICFVLEILCERTDDPSSWMLAMIAFVLTEEVFPFVFHLFQVMHIRAEQEGAIKHLALSLFALVAIQHGFMLQILMIIPCLFRSSFRSFFL